jgi:Na+/proline symporter
MLDPIQFVLLVVIIILTLLLVILGVQVFFILFEVRKTVSKTNNILEKAESITESVKSPLAAISSIALGVKASSLITVAKFIRNLLNHEKDETTENKHHRD